MMKRRRPKEHRKLVAVGRGRRYRKRAIINKGIRYLTPQKINYSSFPNDEYQKQLDALSKYPFAIKYIKNPSEELKLKAVSINPEAIIYIQNPSEELALKAIDLGNPYAIRFIKNPSEEIALKALSLGNPDAIKYIKNPSKLDKKISSPHKPSESGKYYGKFFSHDLFLLSRYMQDKNKDNLIKPDLNELKHLSNSPTIQKLFSHYKGKPITLNNLKEFDQKYSPVSDFEKFIEKRAIPRFGEWVGAQRILTNKKNHVFRLDLPESNISELKKRLEAMADIGKITLPDEKGNKRELDMSGKKVSDVIDRYKNKTNHPKGIKGLTLGWVRFTDLDKDTVLIDEVQSDIPNIIRGIHPNKKMADEADIITKSIFEKFAEYSLGKRGTKQLLMPPHGLKSKLYQHNPPKSVYTELPRKLRFSEKSASEIEGLGDLKKLVKPDDKLLEFKGYGSMPFMYKVPK